MDLTALRSVIDGDPKYASMDDKAVAAALNLKNQDGRVPASDIRDAFIDNQDMTWANIEIVSETEGHAARALALTVVRRLTQELDHSPDPVDVLGAKGQFFLDAMVSAQLIKPEDKAAVEAMAKDRQSVADLNKLGRVRAGDVQYARAL